MTRLVARNHNDGAAATPYLKKAASVLLRFKGYIYKHAVDCNIHLKQDFDEV
jgi:hypothetical protein